MSLRLLHTDKCKENSDELLEHTSNIFIFDKYLPICLQKASLICSSSNDNDLHRVKDFLLISEYAFYIQRVNDCVYTGNDFIQLDCQTQSRFPVL